VRPNRGLVVLLSLALLSGCGGGGHAAPGGLLPGGAASGGSGAGGPATVSVRVTIPSASASSLARRPATISPATQSITVSVNGGPPQIFNRASNCSGTPLVCTLTVGAPFGLDNFLIETWSGPNGSGTALNAATFTLNVKTSGNAPQTVVAGTLLTVTSNADSGGSCGASGPPSGCTLREAVAEAGSDSGTTTAIMFAGVSSITLASTISFQKNITFIGPGASNLTINGGGNQIFAASGNVVLSGLTLAGGNAAGACSASSSGGGCGGAIALNSGTLTVYSSTFSSNSATGAGGAIFTGSGTALSVQFSTFTGNKVNAGSLGSGGAIYLLGDAAIDSSTFTNNAVVVSSSGEGDGGAITQSDFVSIGLTITNSQFSGNSAGGTPAENASGGAVYDGSGGPLTIQNDTFGPGNSAVAGGTSGSATGGALYFFGSTLSDGGAANTFAGNSASAANGSFAGGGAIEAVQGAVALSGANTFSGNLVSTAGEAFGGAIDLETFPSFAPPTLTLGASNAFTSNTAQTTGATDSGAFGGAVNIFTVACNDPQSSGASSARRTASTMRGPSRGAHPAPTLGRLHRPAGALRHPSAAPTGASTIAGTFTSNTAGPSPSYGAGGGALDIASSTGTFLIQNAIFTRNAAVVPSGNTDSGVGGAVAIYGGTVVVLNSQIGTQGAGNQATSLGGGAYVTAYDNAACSSTPFAATLTIGGSTIAGNSVTAATSPSWGGGGIAVEAAGLALGGSTVAGNGVTAPGGGGGGGGGILATNFSDSPFSTLTTLLNSTVFQNASSHFGGGIASVGSGLPASDVLDLIQSTVYENAATGGMGGNLYVDPTINGGTANSGADVVRVQNSIIAGGSAQNPDTLDVYNADTIVSLDYNVVQTPSHASPGSGSCVSNPAASFCSHDIVANPQLASGLANNGGPTQTIADTSSSPGRNAIPFSSATLCNNAPYSNVDQRGFARGTTGRCDVGAYEFAGSSGVTPQPTPTGQVSIPISGRSRRP
jgi:hypothetical protein